MMPFDYLGMSPPPPRLPWAGIRTGFDLVEISGIADSIRRFGDRFKTRLFSPAELAYADSAEELCAERLAARFAAKEAVLKALQLTEAGVGWRDIEVRRLPGGDCALALHGRAAELAARQGASQLALSLSHDGGYAGAFVAVVFTQQSSNSVSN